MTGRTVTCNPYLQQKPFLLVCTASHSRTHPLQKSSLLTSNHTAVLKKHLKGTAARDGTGKTFCTAWTWIGKFCLSITRAETVTLVRLIDLESNISLYRLHARDSRMQNSVDTSTLGVFGTFPFRISLHVIGACPLSQFSFNSNPIQHNGYNANVIGIWRRRRVCSPHG